MEFSIGNFVGGVFVGAFLGWLTCSILTISKLDDLEAQLRSAWQSIRFWQDKCKTKEEK